MPTWQVILLVIALLFAGASVFMWIWNVAHAKKLRAEGFVNKEKNSKKGKLPFKLDKFISLLINALGGINNITNTSVIDKSIKIEILNHGKVDFNQLKKLINNDITVQTDNITITLNKHANKVSAMINDLISLSNTIETEESQDITSEINPTN